MTSERSTGVNSPSRFIIRPFIEADAEQVAAMAGTYFPEKKEADTRQLNRMLIHNLSQPNGSLVCSSPDGTVYGYLSVKMMDYIFDGSVVTGAIFSNFMVNEVARAALIPMRMLQSALKGPQDFSFSDDAAQASRMLWCSLGGRIAYPYSNYYTIPLKPVSFFSHLIFRHTTPGVQSLSSAIAGGIDRMIHPAGSQRFQTASGKELSQQDLTGADFHRGLSALRSRYKLFPAPDPSLLETFIDSIKKETEYGAPSCVALLDSHDRLVGWYICYFQFRTRRCNVIHAECLPGQEENLYASLVSKALTQGAISVSGRLTPGQIGSSFSEKTYSRPGGKWSLVHSKHPDLLHTILSGEAFLTRYW